MLDQLTYLADKYGTDKGTRGHGYTNFYDKIFNLRKNEIKNMLEIGIWDGQSLRMWRDYFPNANISGLDIMDCTKHDDERIKTYKGSQVIKEDLLNIVDKNEPFDFIIDDGGHTMKQQQYSFGVLFEKLKSGGVYIIEDLHTSLPVSKQSCGLDFGANEDYSNTTLSLLQRIYSKHCWADTYHIPENEYNYILNSYKSLQIWRKRRPNGYESITSVIYKK